MTNKIQSILASNDLLNIVNHFGFIINKTKSTHRHITVSNNSTTLIINTSNQRYFNPHDDDDYGNVINFMLNHTKYNSYKDLFSFFSSSIPFSTYPSFKSDNNSYDKKDFSYLNQYEQSTIPFLNQNLSCRKIEIDNYKHHSIFTYQSSITSYPFIKVHSFSVDSSELCGGIILPSKAFIAGTKNKSSIYYNHALSNTVYIYESFFDLVAHQAINISARNHHSQSINGRLTESKIDSILNYCENYSIKNIFLAFDNDLSGFLYSILIIARLLDIELSYKLSTQIILKFSNKQSWEAFASILTPKRLNKSNFEILIDKPHRINIKSPAYKVSTLFPETKDWNEDYIIKCNK